MAQSIYLDYAAATPLDPAVEAAMRPYWHEQFYNPSASYLSAKKVAKDVFMARATVAHWLGARPTEVIFTAGGTEANNLAIHGIMQQYPQNNAVVSAIEHPAALAPVQAYDYKTAPVTAEGIIDLQKLEKLIDDDTVLVSIIYANNEIGTIQPLKQISGILQKFRVARKKNGNTLPLYLHTDASQAANYLNIHTHRLGVDMMTLNGGKIYGPKQTGALYVRTGVQLAPQITGGGQERSMRSGTENVPGIIGFATALEIAQTTRGQESKRLEQLQKQFISELKRAIPNVVINGSLSQRLPNNIHLTIPGKDNERLVMQLDEAGIMCAMGSACSASSDEPSHVLSALGLNDAAAQSSVRFSMGRTTDATSVHTCVQALQQFC